VVEARKPVAIQHRLVAYQAAGSGIKKLRSL
jgi:hypothetical protein